METAGSTRSQTEKHFKSSFRQNSFGWGYNLSDDDIHSINKEVEKFYCNGQPIHLAPLSVKMDVSGLLRQTWLAI